MDDRDYNPFEDEAFMDSLDEQVQDLFDEYPDEWWEARVAEYTKILESKDE